MGFEGGRNLKIVNSSFSRIANDSGISHSQYLSKLPTMPSGVEIIGPTYEEEFTDEDASASILFSVPWTARKPWVDWVLGYALSVPAPARDPGQPPPLSAGVLKRTIPLQHPEFPWLYASKVKLVRGSKAWVQSEYSNPIDGGGVTIRKLDDDGDNELPPLPMISFIDNQGTRHLDGRAIYQVTFRPTKNYEVRTDEEAAQYVVGKPMPPEGSRFVEWILTYSIMAVQIQRYAGNQLFFDEGPDGVKGKQVLEPGVKLFRQYQLLARWRCVPDVPEAAIANCSGRVNQNPFGGVSGLPVYPAETLLLEEPRKVRTRGVRGRVQHEIQYRFNIHPEGWNRFPTAQDGGNFYAATIHAPGSNAPGAKVFQTAPFETLFGVPPPVSYQ